MGDNKALKSMQEEIASELATMDKSVPAPSGFNISLNGNIFTFPDGKTSQDPINVVILDHRNYNRYYTAAYNPTDPKPPTCFAISKIVEGMAPHGEAGTPQADTCEECEWNKWGSAPGGGKGKACRNTVRLAVVAPDADSHAEPMILTLAPTSLKSWTSLVKDLGESSLLPFQVVTNIAFDKTVSFAKLELKALNAHEELETMWGLRDKAQPLLDMPPLAN